MLGLKKEKMRERERRKSRGNIKRSNCFDFPTLHKERIQRTFNLTKIPPDNVLNILFKYLCIEICTYVRVNNEKCANLNRKKGFNKKH